MSEVYSYTQAAEADSHAETPSGNHKSISLRAFSTESEPWMMLLQPDTRTDTSKSKRQWRQTAGGAEGNLNSQTTATRGNAHAWADGTYRPTSMAKSPRMVPGAESDGLVAPNKRRPPATASAPCQTIPTTGPDNCTGTAGTARERTR